jgi:hypothetical protein
MSYPFVASYYRYGVARGPRLAVVWHMAEGYSTVGYLSRANGNGVSVHFVVDRYGKITQMLRFDEMGGSINTRDIRTTDDADGFFGRTAARAVMGVWADTRQSLGPNHASIAVEVEGFALEGPSAVQRQAMAELWLYLQGKYANIRSLGHRDFQDYKRCPGKLIPWNSLGGHGTQPPETDVIPAPITDEEPRIVTANAGHTWRELDGRTVVDNDRPALAERISPFGITNTSGTRLRATRPDTGKRGLVTIVPATNDPVPTPEPEPADCSQEVVAAVDAAIADTKASARIVFDE